MTLLKRTTRKLNLTPLGEVYFKQVQKAFLELKKAEDITKETHSHLQGKIKLTAPVEIGMSQLSDVLAKFLKIHPQLQVEVVLTDRVVDLVGEDIDLALRIGSLKDSSLKSKKIGYSYQKLYSSPEYLKLHSAIKSPQDLSFHDCLIFTNNKRTEWSLEKGPQKQSVQVQGSFSANNLIAIHRMTVNAKGVALLPEFLCSQDVEKGLLIPILNEWRTQKYPIHLVYPNQNYLSKNTRALIDHLASELKEIF